MKTLHYIFFILFILGGIVPVYADSKDTSINKNVVVLVALHTERNRLKEAYKLNDSALIRTIQRDAAEVKKRTIMDFTDHYHEHPVYYVWDSNIDKISAGKFDGIIFNADGSVVTSVPPQFAGKNFVIAYYTRPYAQYPFERVITNDSTRYLEDEARPHNFGLVLYNSKFQQFNYYYRRSKMALEKDMQKYYYQSKRFEIEYYPLAEQLETDSHKKHGILSFFGI